MVENTSVIQKWCAKSADTMKKDPSTARMLLSSSIQFITLKRTKYRKPSLPSVIQIGMSCKSSLELVLRVAGFSMALKQDWSIVIVIGWVEVRLWERLAPVVSAIATWHWNTEESDSFWSAWMGLDNDNKHIYIYTHVSIQLYSCTALYLYKYTTIFAT